VPLQVTELFGYPPDDDGFGASVVAGRCPFVGGTCRKRFSDGMASGLCSAKATKGVAPVICCPQRLYANDYEVLRRVCREAFGPSVPLHTGAKAMSAIPDQGAAIPFGQRLGKELRVGARGTNYSFDWIIAHIDQRGELIELVAVEIQTIDTTGSYRRQSWELQARHGGPGVDGFPEPTVGKGSNFNFENVSKRILPQLITKGHILRVEELCKKGIFFACPTPVLERIYARLGGRLHEYALQPGAITFHDYSLDLSSSDRPYPLAFGKSFTTTHDQVAQAFSAPIHLPPKNSYSDVLRKAIRERFSVG
jgi:hypothetical protein